MAEKTDNKQATEVVSTLNKRTTLFRVVLDTPALLNLVKHCRESEYSAMGALMGVTQREIGDAEDSLLITQTMPKSKRAQMADMMQTIENEK